MQKPDLTCWQGWETNARPAELVSQAHCTAAPTALALWATEAGDFLFNFSRNYASILYHFRVIIAY